MIGIYKYTNKINGHVYIGQSIDIEKRQKNHLYSAFNPKTKDYNSKFHQAIRKYGIDNFDFTILIELEEKEYSQNLLNNLEKTFIKLFNSYKNGYNATEGGDQIGDTIHKGSQNGRSLLTEEDVIYIRNCYNNHITFKEVYKEYENKISKRGFQNIWWFKTWKHIHPEFETLENKHWHSHNAKANEKEIAANNKRFFSEEQIKIMRKEYRNGLSPKQIWLKYAPDKAWSTVYNAITGVTYKNIK